MKLTNGKEVRNSIRGFAWVVLIILSLILTNCGGGGGGGDDEEETMWDGGSGTGAGNAITFWQYYGELEAGEYGSNQAVEVAADGGFIAAGFKASDFTEENRDYFLLKTDNKGIEQWRLTGSSADGQTLNDIRQTTDGGVIAVGFTGMGSSRDVLVVKTDADGKLQWSKTYDTGESALDEAHSISVLSDGYAIAGGGGHNIATGENPPFVVDDLWFFKIDTNGNKVGGSDRFISLPGWSRAYAMEQTNDGGFILTGFGPPNSVFVARLDENGDEIWSGVYGTGIGYAVCQLPAPDNGFIIAGSTPPFADDASDALVIKIDASGNELWRKVFGGSHRDYGYGVTPTFSGDIIVIGETGSFGGSSESYDFYMIKLDNDGKTIWQKVKGISPKNYETAYDVEVTSDGGFVVAGSAQAMNMLAKFDENGDTIVLGDLDFTYTVSGTTGLINSGNARGIASIALDFITLPIEVGSFPLDLLIDTLNGIPPGDLCDKDGTYSWNKPVEAPVTAQDEYVLTFSGCKSGPLDDPSTYNGTMTLSVDQVSGDIAGDDYEIRVIIDSVDLTFTDDMGDSTITGGITYSRISTGGDFAERVETDGKNLIFSDNGESETLTQLDINSTRTAAGQFSIGNIGQYAIINTDLITGALTVRVEDPISGLEEDEPDSGKLLAEAQDGSSMTITLVEGGITLEVDTDADGEIDGTISVDELD